MPLRVCVRTVTGEGHRSVKLIQKLKPKRLRTFASNNAYLRSTRLQELVTQQAGPPKPSLRQSSQLFRHIFCQATYTSNEERVPSNCQLHTFVLQRKNTSVRQTKYVR